MQKQAEWGLPAGSSQYSQALTGTPVTPPPYMRDQAAKADASKESVAAFKEGLRNGVLKGDSVRGLIRGGANGMADTIDYLYDAPTRSAFAPAMLLAKAVTAVTGNPGYENQVRGLRDSTLLIGNWLPHLVSKGYRGVANSSILDPKHLDPVDYALAEASGKYGVEVAAGAIEASMPGSNIVFAAQLPDIVTTAGNQVVQEAAKEIAAQQPQEPAAKPVRGTPVWDAVKAVEKSRAERSQRIADMKEAYKAAQERAAEVKTQLRKDKRLEQSLAAGVGGYMGFVATNEILKHIPVLRKKRILRYLIDAAAAGGLGYAGWKWMGR